MVEAILIASGVAMASLMMLVACIITSLCLTTDQSPITPAATRGRTQKAGPKAAACLLKQRVAFGRVLRDQSNHCLKLLQGDRSDGASL